VTRRDRGDGRRLRDEAGQRLLIEGVDENSLDGVVAILADGVGAGTGSVDARSAVPLGEPEDTGTAWVAARTKT